MLLLQAPRVKKKHELEEFVGFILLVKGPHVKTMQTKSLKLKNVKV